MAFMPLASLCGKYEMRADTHSKIARIIILKVENFPAKLEQRAIYAESVRSGVK